MKYHYRDWRRADHFLCGRPRRDQAPLTEFVTVLSAVQGAAEARDRRLEAQAEKHVSQGVLEPDLGPNRQWNEY